MNFLDQSVLNFFTHNRVEGLIFIMLIITYSGSYIVVSGLTFLSALSFYIHKHTARILPLLVAVGGSSITTFILKNILNRERPLGAVYPETDPSFPSGHATVAMALYGFLLYTIWKHDKHYLKNPLIVFLAILIVLIGISRLYLGVHYFTDILAGYLVGFVWILIVSKIENKIEKLLNWRPKIRN